METTGDRIKEIVGLLRLNPFSFATKVGVSGNMIYNIIGGRRSSPSADLLEKIKIAFPQVNMNWLVAGVGKPIIDIRGNAEISVTEELKKQVLLIEELAISRAQHIEVLQKWVNELKKELKSSKKKTLKRN